MEASNRIMIALAGLGFTLALPLAHAAAESQAALQAEAKVTEQDALIAALAKVPNGTVQNSALKNQRRRLVWSEDFAKPKTKNLTGVQVDAKTGKIAALKLKRPPKRRERRRATRRLGSK